MIQLPSHRAPAVALVSLALVAAFVGLEPVALSPARLLAEPEGHAPALALSALAHADVTHLLGNLVFLAGAGSVIERRLGAVRLFALLLLSAIAAGLGHVLAGETSLVIGASGAVAGVIGAQLAVAPQEEVPVLNLLMLPRPVLRVPAWLPVAVWAAVQAWVLLSGDREVAVYSHLGGFAAGVVLGALARGAE